MAKSPRSRPGRGASQPPLVNPRPPNNPLPRDDDCVVDDDDAVCTLTHHHHQHQQHHIDNVARYVARAFKVLGVRALIRRRGIEAVHAVALEFAELVQEGTFAHIQNPAGFFVWSVQQLAEGQTEASHLRAVDDQDAEVGT